jgi:hypothetical protein
MFLTAVAKPLYDEQGKETFEGKIGIWAFVKKTEAENDSKNRLKGTMELTSIIVTRNVMREYICEKVVSSIAALWPDNKETIFIQQDNARTHILRDDPMFLASMKNGMGYSVDAGTSQLPGLECPGSWLFQLNSVHHSSLCT